MALQNRVTPDMQVVAENWRGDFMGNRGGRIHDPETKTLLKRKWASKRWIICVTSFKDRKRTLMGDGYTELFFLDEVSAMAAGHRPCFECRRRAANEFSKLWIEEFGRPEKSLADAMDKQLHLERTSETPISRDKLALLPEGAMIKTGGKCYARKNDVYLLWSGAGYHETELPEGDIQLLTPASSVAMLKNGYSPQWHKSAD